MYDRFERFTLSIFSISRYWNKIATEEMKKYGLRGTYALYLVMIAGYEGEITAARLADLCQRDKADVSRAVAIFQEKGILEPYKGAKYRVNLTLTEEGKKLAGQIRGRAGIALQKAGRGLSEELREDMYQSLDIIAENMRQICENGLTDDGDAEDTGGT